MLERLQIKNFQKHKLLRLTFAGPGVTTITGDNDQGKSTILRALKWVCQNRPNKESVRRRDENDAIVPEDCVVTLWVDGHKITRLRGDDDNLYALDGAEYKALGREVPEDISNLLNLGSANFQMQLDAPFWFTESGGKISEALNAVVNLSAIDTTLDDLRRRANKAKNIHDVSKERLALFVARKQELKFVGLADSALAVVEDLDVKAANAIAGADYLRTLHTRAQTWRQRAAATGRLATLGAAALVAATAARKVALRAAALRTAVTTARANRAKRLPPATMAAMDKCKQDYQDIARRRDRLKYLMAEVLRLRGHVSQTRGQYTNAQVHFDSYTKDEVCPVCQKPLQSPS